MSGRRRLSIAWAGLFGRRECSPDQRQFEIDRVEGFRLHAGVAFVRADQDPAASLEPEHLESTLDRIDEPRVLDLLAGVDRQLLDTVHHPPASGECQ